MPLRLISMLSFQTSAEMHAPRLAKKRILSFVIDLPVETWKPVKIWHILICAEVEKKVKLLRGEQVD